MHWQCNSSCVNNDATFSAPIPQNGQAHSNNADELFECVWPYFGIGAERVKIAWPYHKHKCLQ